ncbi:carbohydrate sulfotransferase 2-like [Erpetoichthys calabaricus]|uniref:carbohydrate sulfotransferase 2-like n=1 Tax=Erpetoichthys calabaricus TaxID=27687 RepID=UPI00109F8CDF|nr:carbohydrate sulfotransferase 2-like [Erpetoichthys calabaricus]
MASQLQKINILFFLTLLFTVMNLFGYMWNKIPQHCNEITPTSAHHSMPSIRPLKEPLVAKKRQLVYIFSTWRSGSSFFGEIFNQDPAVFFLYEPLWHIWKRLYPGDALSLQGASRDMLRSLYHCDFSIFQLYHVPVGNNFTTNDIFAAFFNKVICSYPICSAYRKDVVKQVDAKVCSKCPPRNLRLLEKECLKYNTIVVKGVRIFDLNVLAPLLEDPSMEIKIIHLVRDPRAVTNSRIRSVRILEGENVHVAKSRNPKSKRISFFNNSLRRSKFFSHDYHSAETMDVICQQTGNTLLTVQKSPAWLNGKYMLVRYEDFIEDPVNRLKEIYSFINIPLVHSIKLFAFQMTRGPSGSFSPFVVSSRNSTITASAWRKGLTFPQISQVQELCSFSMNILGYKLAGSEEEVSKINNSLLLPPKL